MAHKKPLTVIISNRKFSTEIKPTLQFVLKYIASKWNMSQ